MDGFRFFDGMVRVELTSADIPMLLKRISEQNIVLTDILHKDGLCAAVSLSRRDYTPLRNIVQRLGGSVKLLKRHGIYWTCKRLLTRPVLFFSILALLALSLFLPTRVLFIRVEGNQTVPTKLILEQAASCGISFGASRQDVRSEKMKNNLLSAIPELQWAGVNTDGCTAVISVRERTVTDRKEQPLGVSRIVAARDGIITSCTVTQGTAVCKTGQAVKAGETLVSGYTDCGISIQATRAQGEIFAKTRHDLTVLTPLNYAQKGDQTGTEKKYSLIIGKKRINFYKDSGISGTTCDKMYLEYYLTLPGGFRLPIALAVEQWTMFDGGTASVSAESAREDASEFAQAYLLDQMISGQILVNALSANEQNGLLVLQGQYMCLEMIGRVQSEEIIQHYGKNN